MPDYMYLPAGVSGPTGNLVQRQMNQATDRNPGMQRQGSLGNLGDIPAWWNKRNAPQIGPNPYQADWTNLVNQLMAQSTGQGPSLAMDAYKQAHQTGMNNVLAMSRGGTAGGARMGMQTLGRMNQGLSQGLANARLQEQLAARQALAQALTGAGNAWFQPQQANLDAQMRTPTNGAQLLSFVNQLLAGGAQVGAWGTAQPAGAAAPTKWLTPSIPMA